jgi:hypothetical protein
MLGLRPGFKNALINRSISLIKEKKIKELSRKNLIILKERLWHKRSFWKELEEFFILEKTDLLPDYLIEKIKTVLGEDYLEKPDIIKNEKKDSKKKKSKK